MSTTAKTPSPGRLMWRYLRGSRRFLGLMLVLELASNGAALLQPLVVEQVLDALEDGASLSEPILLLAGASVASVVLVGLSSLALGKFSQRVVLDVRRGLAARLLGSPVGAIEARPSGDLLSRVGSDTALLQSTLSMALVQGATAPFVLASVCVILAFQDLVLLAVVLVLLLATGIAEWCVLNRLYDAITREQQGVGRITTAVHRVLTAFRVVKASGTEARELRAIEREARDTYRAGARASRLDAVVETVAASSVELLFLAVLTVGAQRISAGAMDVSTLVAFLLYVIYLREPVETFSNAAGAFSEGLAAISRVEAINRLPAEVDAPAVELATAGRDGNALAGSTAGEIVFDGVSFRYDGDPVLADVSFVASRGLTMLVGASGAGKTTVFNLLERFDEIDSGAILLDGVDVRHYARGALRRRLAYVEQATSLLGNTVRSALRYGVTDADADDLARGLSAVGLDEWVALLPDGLDTRIGEQGIALSGGQRQRLAVARSLLRDADVLLLDEATSQLDPLSERCLLSTVADQAELRTVLAITHRLDLAGVADQVIWLDGGTVRAIGRHDELLEADERYRQLAGVAVR